MGGRLVEEGRGDGVTDGKPANLRIMILTSGQIVSEEKPQNISKNRKEPLGKWRGSPHHRMVQVNTVKMSLLTTSVYRSHKGPLALLGFISLSLLSLSFQELGYIF
jgi:hypothetical protein